MRRPGKALLDRAVDSVMRGLFPDAEPPPRRALSIHNLATAEPECCVNCPGGRYWLLYHAPGFEDQARVESLYQQGLGLGGAALLFGPGGAA